MNRSDALSLAVVGHTNTGKTSLLRTLTRDSRFGEVSDRAATTRDVQGAALLANGKALVALYDTPGLEDASALSDFLDTVPGPHADPVTRIEAFLAGDHDQGRFEQEAKVLRQLLRSEAALYVIDAREPVLAKHRDELRVLAECGRPLLPVLNFTASVDADPEQWRSQLARMGLHVIASFDTVLFDFEAEHEIFEKLGVLLESRRSQLERLSASAPQRSRKGFFTQLKSKFYHTLVVISAPMDHTILWETMIIELHQRQQRRSDRFSGRGSS